MQSRVETATPIVVWICTAAVVHFISYKGADEVVTARMDDAQLRQFVSSVRASWRGDDPSEPLEVTLDPSALDAAALAVAPRPVVPVPVPPAVPTTPPAPAAVTPPKSVPTTPPPAVTPPPTVDKRVAVQQKVEDKGQQDNPNAKFIANDANHVKEESVARITARDQNHPDPQPGSNARDNGTPGNADKTRIAESDDHPGQQRSSAPTSVGPVADAKSDRRAPEPASGEKSRLPTPDRSKVAALAPPVPTPVAEGGASAPDAPSTRDGTYAVNPRRDPQRSAANASESSPPGQPASSAPYVIPKLGGGAGPNGRNLNLSPGAAVAAIGEGTLQREREFDRERRRSTHRGGFRTPDPNRWRAAIENYVAAVKPGNQTALNTARAPFATYLNEIHNKLHPIFAEDYLDSLTSLGAKNPINRPELFASLEVVVSKGDGHIVRIGIVKTSGVTAFDAAALDSMQRASPFGTPPSAIVSPDGNVYLHWEFHREPQIACSTVNARPFMLKSSPDGGAAGQPGPRVPTETPRSGREV